MSFIQNSTNSRRLSNELQQIGNSSPPNMANVSEKVLSAASPKGFNLVNTKTDLTSSDAESKRCREFTDITGLRNLQKEQINRTHYDAGCGWRYRPSNGIFPEINQGAAGTANGPLALYSGPGGKDEVVGGTRWYWNLKDAERDITTKICQSASKCNQLSMLGRYAEICGYCKTSGAVIPVQNIGGTFSARYNDATLGCATSNIVTATTGKCEGFTGQTIQKIPGTQKTRSMQYNTFGSAGGSLPSKRNLSEAFKGREGFLDLDALNQCMDSPLSRDCVILAARTAGCADEGTLITALKVTAPNADYDSVLKTNSVYATYNSVAVPRLTPATLKDGSVSMATALDDFGNLMRNTQNNNQKLALSARDLCVRKGEYDAYDFCSELAPTTIIDNTTLPCIQQAWLNNGGTKEGKMYPGDSWKGKSYQSFLTSMSQTKDQIKSKVKTVNVKGIREFVGANSEGSQPTLPRDANTRGAETVWFHCGETTVILRCDLALNTEVVPHFENTNQLMSKYNFLSPDNKAYTSAFEIRSDTDQSMKFSVVTDDGFMLSVNQNPFEGTANKGNDWGSWAYQPANRYNSPAYPVNSDNSGKTNTIVTKWFNGQGGATSQTFINYLGKQIRIADAEVYLTQEPLAPWMQFEVCTRPNDDQGNANGFFEKRFNGPCAFKYNDTNARYSGFDVMARSVVIQTDKSLREQLPKKLPYITFTSTSFWSTKSYIHAGAVRTVTILVGPTATLSNNGGVGVLFTHSNGTTFNIETKIMNSGGNYTIQYSAKAFGNDIGSSSNQIKMNEWNLIVIQYIGDANGLRRTSFHIQTLNNLRDTNQRNQFATELNLKQSISGTIVAGNPKADYNQNSGFFTLGAWASPSFTGGVAWIHGFRNFLDTDELLKNEIQQSWLSRWPRGNLDSEV